ncbi:hypothetical protein VTI74DRAFT_2628 [Chaetomium olivicolor]
MAMYESLTVIQDYPVVSMLSLLTAKSKRPSNATPKEKKEPPTLGHRRPVPNSLPDLTAHLSKESPIEPIPEANDQADAIDP